GAVLLSGVALAQDDIAKRKANMKAVGKATKQTVQMVKGDIPFDAAKAKANMDTIAGAWEHFSKYFPKGSETGGKTTAAAKIWTDFADFDSKGKKMSADAAIASEAAGKGADAFKAAFDPVMKSCKGCHQDYRVKKD
ncbi:MAG: c-type cytochrome, partial [Hyphomicrobiaceae bacterium]